MKSFDFNYTLTFHTGASQTESMNSQGQAWLTSKVLQAMMDKDNAHCKARKEVDPGWQQLDKIDIATGEVEAAFVDLLHKLQMREQVGLEEYCTDEAIQKEHEGFDVLKSTIADRDALLDGLKKMRDAPKNFPAPVNMSRPAPHDPKNGPEPVNHFTKSAEPILIEMLQDERFHSIRGELETIFDLMTLQATRHNQIKQEEEKTILALGLDLKECERALAKVEKKLSATRKELGASKEDAANLMVYVEDLNEKIKEQDSEKIVWKWEMDGLNDKIAELRMDILALEGSSAAYERAVESIERLKTVVRILENAGNPKDIEISLLKNNLIAKEKELSQLKSSFGSKITAKEETINILTRELQGMKEQVADLGRELGEKVYELRSLKSSRPVSSKVPRQSPLSAVTSNDSVLLLRRIADIEVDYVQLKTHNQTFRNKNIEHEDTIKNLKRQLDLKEAENGRLQTDINGLTNQISDALFRSRR